MIKSKRKTLYLYFQNNGVDDFVGTIYFDPSKSKDGETSSFRYDEEYLRKTERSPLYGLLHRDLSAQYPPIDGSSTIFPFIEDICPDRWGQALIWKKEIEDAKKEGRNRKTLLKSDFLASIDDTYRKGAFRIKREKDGDFIASAPPKIPPELFLNRLEQISKDFEDGKDISEEDLGDLLRQGSSLGGARPKANIYGPDGSLHLAKFPSKNDEYDVGAFEKLVNELASLSGISVPESGLEKISPNGSIFLAKRFDRDGERRIHFVSAMCLLGAHDGEGDHSYLEIADIIAGLSSHPREDLRELFKRIAFNIAIGNSDDHLRNHGFLFDGIGYRLSPAYDLNPGFQRKYLSLAIDEHDPSMSFSTLKETAGFYDMSAREADEIIERVKNAVSSNLEPLAKRLGISKRDFDYMRPAFDFSARK